jgi:outer membrane protein
MIRIARLAMLAAIALGCVTGQGVKLGIVNSQKAMLDTSEIKKAQLDLETKYKPRQEQLAQLQKDLSLLQAQIQSGKLTPAAQQDVTAQGQRKEREYQRVSEDLQADVDRDRNDILARTSQRMREVVSKLGNEKGLDVVIDSANTVFYKAALDLTAEATVAYDKAYPASPASK